MDITAFGNHAQKQVNKLNIFLLLLFFQRKSLNLWMKVKSISIFLSFRPTTNNKFLTNESHENAVNCFHCFRFIKFAQLCITCLDLSSFGNYNYVLGFMAFTQSAKFNWFIYWFIFNELAKLLSHQSLKLRYTFYNHRIYKFNWYKTIGTSNLKF